MSDVPPELMSDIFTRLPVKSLLRFRSLSKPVCALIDSAKFINLHLNRSLKSNSTLLTFLTPNGNTNVKPIDSDTIDRSFSLLDHPTDYELQVVGSCHGLVCFSTIENVVLWNPSTREHKHLPVSKIELFDGGDVLQNLVYGFGYDPLTNDYKVLRIAQFMMANRREVKVFSLKSNSWARLKDLPSEFFLKKSVHGVLVNDALHWALAPNFRTSDYPEGRRIISSNEDHSVIISFDLATEKFKLVPQPTYSEKIMYISVGEIGSKLCVRSITVHVHSSPYVISNMDIWVMNTYGVEDSWMKLFSVADSVNTLTFGYLDAIVYSDNGKKVLLEQEGGKFLWYDFQHRNVRDIRSPGIPMAFNAYNCTRSLVKLHAGARTDVAWEKPKGMFETTVVNRTDDDLMESFWRISNKRGKLSDETTA